MRPRSRLPLRVVPVMGVLGALALASPAWAHSGLTPDQVKANTPTDVALVIEHGCGSSPISKVAVRLPPEVVDVTPEAPEGWTVAVVGDVVTWEGAARPVLDDLRVGLTLTARAEPGDELPFPVVQTCTNGEEIRWIEDVVDDGTESTRPLARLRVVEGAPMPATPATTAAPATTIAATTSTAGPPSSEAATSTVAAGPTTTPTPTTAPGAGGAAAGTTAAGASGPTTTVVDRSVNSTGGVLAGFGGAAVVVLGGVILYLRNRRPGIDAN